MLQLKINTGAVTVPIISETGETIGSFRFNPTDSNILSRLDAVASYFQSVDYDKGAGTTVEEITELDGIIKEKFDYLLGYPVSGELFKACGPLSPTGNGSLFFLEVLEGIAELCNQALADRAKAMDNIREATAGYLTEEDVAEEIRGKLADAAEFIKKVDDYYEGNLEEAPDETE